MIYLLQSNEKSDGSTRAKMNPPKKVAEMLESFRAVRRSQFKPNPRVSLNLCQAVLINYMGAWGFLGSNIF